jgi:hypothetical protein
MGSDKARVRLLDSGVLCAKTGDADGKGATAVGKGKTVVWRGHERFMH